MKSKHLSVVWQDGHVSPEERTALLGQRPATVWLTGLSGAGKSTLAFALERYLIGHGHACYVLDGDNVRHGLNRDLGFSAKDRSENIRRIAEVAKLINDAGLIVITAFISPFLRDRAMAREIIGPERFIEAHLCAAIGVCETRDSKGLYRKARAGEIPEFTGITSPYEAPEHPAVTIDTERMTVEASVNAIMGPLASRLHRR